METRPMRTNELFGVIAHASNFEPSSIKVNLDYVLKCQLQPQARNK